MLTEKIIGNMVRKVLGRKLKGKVPVDVVFMTWQVTNEATVSKIATVSVKTPSRTFNVDFRISTSDVRLPAKEFLERIVTPAIDILMESILSHRRERRRTLSVVT